MAQQKHSTTITIGAALGAGFRSVIGSAEADISRIGGALKQMNAQQKNAAAFKQTEARTAETGLALASETERLTSLRNELAAASARVGADFAGADAEAKRLGQTIRALDAQSKALRGYALKDLGVREARTNVQAEGKRLQDLRRELAIAQNKAALGDQLSAEQVAPLTKEIEAQANVYEKARVELERRTLALDKERAAMRAAGIDTGNLSSETERLARETTAAKQAQQEATEKAEAASSANKQQAQEVKRLSSAVAAQEGKVKAADAAHKRQTATLERERAALQKAGVDTAKLGSEMARLERQAKRAEAGLAALGRVRAVGNAFTEMRREVGRAGLVITGTVSAAAFGIYRLTKSVADAGDEAAETAAALGTTGTALQGLRYAGQRVGVEAEKMDAALNQFNQRLEDARGGSGEAADALRELGLDAEMLAQLPLSQRMALVADAFKGYQGSVSKSALATQLFGSKAYKMANVLDLGADGLRKLREEGKRTGAILDPKALALADEFDGALGRFKGTMMGVRNTIGVELMPILSEFFGALSDDLAANGDSVRQFARDFGALLRDALPQVVSFGKTLLQVMLGVGKAFTTVSKLVGGLDNVLLIFTALVGAKAIVSIGVFINSCWLAVQAIGALAGVALPSLGSALGFIASTAIPAVLGALKAMTIFLFTNPIGWALLAIGAAAFVIWKNWEPLKEFFTNLWVNPRKALADFVKFALGAFSPLFNAIDLVAGFFGMDLKGKVGGLIDRVLGVKETGKQAPDVTPGAAFAETAPQPMPTIKPGAKGKVPSRSIWNQPGDALAGAEAADSAPAIRTEQAARVAQEATRSAPANITQTDARTYSFTVNAAPGQDAREIAEEVRRRLQAEEANNRRAALYDSSLAPAY